MCEHRYLVEERARDDRVIISHLVAVKVTPDI